MENKSKNKENIEPISKNKVCTIKKIVEYK